MPDPVSLDPTEVILTDDSRRKFAAATPFHHALQRRHFFLFEVLPFVGTVVAFAAVASSAGQLDDILDSVDRFVWSHPEVEVLESERSDVA